MRRGCGPERGGRLSSPHWEHWRGPTLYAQTVVTLPANLPIVPAHSAAARLPAFEHIQLKLAAVAQTRCQQAPRRHASPPSSSPQPGGDSLASPAAPLSTFIRADAAQSLGDNNATGERPVSEPWLKKCRKRLLGQSDGTKLHHRRHLSPLNFIRRSR